MKKHALSITTPSDCELAMIRVFDAPRELVFRAWTEPVLLQRWLGVHNGWAYETCEVDLRVGGGYRFVWRNPSGNRMGMRGTYLEIAAPERLVSTEVFDEAWYEGDAVNTLRLVEEGGRTTSISTVRYASKEVRDGVLRSPMESGVVKAYDTLDTVLATLGAGKAAG